MTIYNQGEIKTNMPITERVYGIILGCLEDDTVAEVGGNLISIGCAREYFDSDIASVIEEMIMLVTKDNPEYVFNGRIDYFGDYEGSIDITNNEVTNIPIEDTSLFYADDATLITILEKRGYKVIKNTGDE